MAAYGPHVRIEVSWRLPDVAEVFALVRGLRSSLDVLELRGDLVDLLRLVLELVERDLDAQILRQDVQDGLRALRVDEVTGGRAPQAPRLPVLQPSGSP